MAMAGLGAREVRGGDDSEGAVSKGLPKRQPEGNPMYTLRLHVVRRGELQASADHNPAMMDPDLWRKIPDDIMWSILKLVPAVKRYQFQAVSPKWRQALTSANFRTAVAAREQQRGGEPADRSIIACVSVIDNVLGAGCNGRRFNLNNSPAVMDMDIDLSFLPSTFWESGAELNPAAEASGGAGALGVLAAADGLVWITRRDKSQWYVLNPLTRTCRMLTELPSTSVTDYDYNESFLHMDAGTVKSFQAWYRFSDQEYDCELLTSDLAAPTAAWTVARGRFHVDLQDVDPDDFKFDRLAARGQYFVSCQGEHYYYVDGMVFVYAVSPRPGPDGVDRLVHKAEVGAPQDPHRHLFEQADLCLVVCRGRVFLIAKVGIWDMIMISDDGADDSHYDIADDDETDDYKSDGADGSHYETADDDETDDYKSDGADDSHYETADDDETDDDESDNDESDDNRADTMAWTSLGEGCCVWVLLRDTMEWQEVGMVDRHELDRLTGFKYSNWTFQWTLRACAVGDLICFKLYFRDDGRRGATVEVGLNVVTCTWELVCDHEEWLKYSHTFELKPNLFISE